MKSSLLVLAACTAVAGPATALNDIYLNPLRSLIADIYPPHPPQAVLADIYPPHPPQAVLADIYPPHPPQVAQEIAGTGSPALG